MAEKSCVPHIFKASIEDYTAYQLVSFARTQYMFQDRLDMIQRRHTELTGKGIPEWKFQNPQSLTFRRLFNCMAILKTDLKDQIGNGGLKKVKDNPKDKNEPKPPHQLLVDLKNAVDAAYTGLMLHGKGSPLFRLIGQDMNSEHTKDISECLDALFQVENVTRITEIIYDNLVPEGMEV
jgi:hypothetical protein